MTCVHWLHDGGRLNVSQNGRVGCVHAGHEPLEGTAVGSALSAQTNYGKVHLPRFYQMLYKKKEMHNMQRQEEQETRAAAAVTTERCIYFQAIEPQTIAAYRQCYTAKTTLNGHTGH